MKKMLAAIVVLTLGMAMTVVHAAPQSYKVGVVDVGKILQQDPQMQQMNKKLQERFKTIQDKIEAAAKQLQSDQEKLKRDTAILSQVKAADLKEKIVREERDLARMKQDFYQDARSAQNQAMKTILDSVKAIVEKIAKSDNYDLVLQRNNVAFASDRVDITEKVIAKLKASRKSAKANNS